jgi:hypothetical protein
LDAIIAPQGANIAGDLTAMIKNPLPKPATPKPTKTWKGWKTSKLASLAVRG